MKECNFVMTDEVCWEQRNMALACMVDLDQLQVMNIPRGDHNHDHFKEPFIGDSY